jgi:thioredoxin:protein disulfide reductase
MVFLLLLLAGSISCSTQKVENNPTTASTSPAASTQPRNSADMVKAVALPAEVKPNDTTEATVQVTVQKGYHINANPPTFPYLIGTELSLQLSPPLSVSFIVYPDPITKTFPFAEKPLAVYEGTATLKVRLKADKSAQPGTQNLSGKLRVQACDDQVCYAPGTLTLSIPLTIK